MSMAERKTRDLVRSAASCNELLSCIVLSIHYASLACKIAILSR